MLTSMTALD